jgi:hypothetical protein
MWVGTLAITSAVACGVALLLATLGATAASFAEYPVGAQANPPSSETRVFEGMLTCSRCGAKHSASLSRNAADCVRICAHGGAAFTLVQGERVFKLEGDPEALKQLAARRVRVTGVLQGDTIQVSDVIAAD